MTGIVSYGGYLPLNRIRRDIIFNSMGWIHQATYMKGEKCVANFDEDSVTMAVASAGILLVVCTLLPLQRHSEKEAVLIS